MSSGPYLKRYISTFVININFSLGQNASLTCNATIGYVFIRCIYYHCKTILLVICRLNQTWLALTVAFAFAWWYFLEIGIITNVMRLFSLIT
jgi:hypothetical protein